MGGQWRHLRTTLWHGVDSSDETLPGPALYTWPLTWPGRDNGCLCRSVQPRLSPEVGDRSYVTILVTIPSSQFIIDLEVSGLNLDFGLRILDFLVQSILKVKWKYLNPEKNLKLQISRLRWVWNSLESSNILQKWFSSDPRAEFIQVVHRNTRALTTDQTHTNRITVLISAFLYFHECS